jgi:hypothetical protein
MPLFGPGQAKSLAPCGQISSKAGAVWRQVTEYVAVESFLQYGSHPKIKSVTEEAFLILFVYQINSVVIETCFLCSSDKNYYIHVNFAFKKAIITCLVLSFNNNFFSLILLVISKSTLLW